MTLDAVDSSFVRPPHEILQGWNARVSVFVRPRAIDKIIADERTAVSRVWNDNMLPVGLEWSEDVKWIVMEVNCLSQNHAGAKSKKTKWIGMDWTIDVCIVNRTCVARNCFDVLWVRQLTLIGISHGIQYFTHGTDGLINNWSTMVSKCGQRNIHPNIGNSQVTLLDLMKTLLALKPLRWNAWTVIFSMANSTTQFWPLASLGHLA